MLQHLIPYWCASGTIEMKVTNQCLINFTIDVDVDDEVTIDVIPLSI